MSEQRVLPADVYDTFEFASLAVDGIGAGKYFTADGVPLCIHGLDAFAEGGFHSGELCAFLEAAKIDPVTSDNAVRAINTRKRRADDRRVSWKEYTRELNIVRGD